jgi:hypothetical protein
MWRSQRCVKDGTYPQVAHFCPRAIEVSVSPIFFRPSADSVDSFAASGMLAIGDVEQLSPSASVMLRVATLTAWAELEIAGTMQAYLLGSPQASPCDPSDLVGLVTERLCYQQRGFGSASRDGLRRYGHDLNEPWERGSSAGMQPITLTSSMKSLNHIISIKIESWSPILKAVSITMQRHDPHILAAVDGRDVE